MQSSWWSDLTFWETRQNDVYCSVMSLRTVVYRSCSALVLSHHQKYLRLFFVTCRLSSPATLQLSMTLNLFQTFETIIGGLTEICERNRLQKRTCYWKLKNGLTVRVVILKTCMDRHHHHKICLPCTYRKTNWKTVHTAFVEYNHSNRKIQHGSKSTLGGCCKFCLTQRHMNRHERKGNEFWTVFFPSRFYFQQNQSFAGSYWGHSQNFGCERCSLKFRVKSRSGYCSFYLHGCS